MPAMIFDALYEGGGTESGDTGVLAGFAKKEGIDIDLLKATAAHESPEGAYDDAGRLPFLPEAHKFWRNLPADKRDIAVRRGLARRNWSRSKQYKGLGGTGSDARWQRFKAMAEINETAAVKSCSWGRYQILGENYRMCGYSSAEEFVLSLASSEKAHDEAFVAYIRSARLVDELRDYDLRGFIRGYNGAGQVNYYLGRISNQYRQATGKSLPDIKSAARSDALRMGMMNNARVTALQQRLNDLGFHVVSDGDFGPTTRMAVVSFQANIGIAADGLVGPKTQAALEKAQFKLPDERAKAQPEDMAESSFFAGARKIKQLSMAGAGLIGVSKGSEKTGALDWANDLIGQGQTIQQIIGAGSDLVELAARNWWVVLIIAALFGWWIAQSIEDKVVDRHQTGRSV